MSKGRLDYSYDIIYQSQRKKDKVADCIYLDESRQCHCQDNNYVYLSRCNNATYCKYRIRSTEQESAVQNIITTPIKHKPVNVELCPFKVGDQVIVKPFLYSQKFNNGVVVNVENNMISIEVDGILKKISMANMFQNRGIKLKTLRYIENTL